MIIIACWHTSKIHTQVNICFHSQATRVISEAIKIEDQAWQQSSQSVDTVYQLWKFNIYMLLDVIMFDYDMMLDYNSWLLIQLFT